MIFFDHVSKTYPDGTVAIEQVDLTIATNELVVFVGPSGCGKTTLMNMVNRLVEPSSGRVVIDGVDIASLPVTQLRRSIGYVMQNDGLFPHYTVAQNIMVSPRLSGVSAAKARDDVPRLLRTVGLDDDYASRYPHQLSGGQRQRVGIARALASSPRVLLMDEPFGALDPTVRRTLQDELLSIHRSSETTIIMVTHDMSEALHLADRLVVLGKRSRILQEGSARDLIAHPVSDEVASFVSGSQDAHLTIQTVGGKHVVHDGQGRPLGVVS